MENKKTPKPGSKEYDPDQPQSLIKPDFNSSTDHRKSEELPATENLNDEQSKQKGEDKLQKEDSITSNVPKPDLGSENRKSDDEEKEREKIITP